MMLTYENLHVVNQLFSNNSYNIPKVAKELGFHFSLRKGRIDWRKIDNLDIDNLIHETDLPTLEDNIINVVNCNLDNEYDFKILDPNFVKIFKLAQLSIEYLTYVKDHLLNFLQAVQAQVKDSFQEIEKLKVDSSKKDEDIKLLKKRIKEKENLPFLIQQLNAHSYLHGAFHRCSYCGKAFINKSFLQGHYERRHPEASVVQDPINEPNPTVNESLHNEVRFLKERLSATERLLQDSKEQNILALKQTEQEYQKKFEEWQLQHEQQIANMQSHLQSHIQNTQNTNPVTIQQLEQLVNSQEQQIKSLREAMNFQADENLKILENKLEEQTCIWKKHVAEMESKRIQIVQELQQNMNKESNEVITSGQYMSDYEDQIQELKSTASLQEHQLKQQKKELEVLQEKLEKVSAAHRIQSVDPLIHVSDNTPLKPTSNSSAKLVENIVSAHSINSSPIINQETVSSEETTSGSSESSAQCTVVTTKPAQEKTRNYSVDKNNYITQKNLIEDPSSLQVFRNSHKGPLPASDNSINKLVSVGDETEESSSSAVSESSTNESQVPTIQRLKQTIASNPHILAKLKEDLQILMNQRLRELGVDPEWSKLPQATFAQKMLTLQHQQNLTAKRYKDYFKIRKNLLSELQNKVPEAVSAKRSVHREEKNVPADKTDNRALQIDKIMNREKNKTQNVLHTLKDEGAHIQKSSITYKEKNITSQKPSKNATSQKLRLADNRKDTRKVKAIQEGKHNTESVKEISVHSQRGLNSKGEIDERHTAVSNKENEIAKQKGNIMLTSTPYSKRNLITTNSESSSPLSSSIPSPVTDIKNIKMPKPGENRSVLKTTSNINNNHSKKRVVFEDEGKGVQRSKDLALIDSWSSPNEEIQHNKDESSFSSDEILTKWRQEPQEGKSIKLKTLQSDKITQLASELSSQLLSRHDKPLGGVDTMFSPEESSGPPKPDSTASKVIDKNTQDSKTLQLSDWDLEDLDDFE